ncbi:MAG: hypothetical protein JO137_14170 [Hyphomicrobiales bacterium]|nr:hypothetical protein [Hyphomicrobiales bacterium]MBV9432962.1 hypothetical protein [Hyphomicrobiales bacterium]
MREKDGNLVSELRALSRDDDVARQLFEWAANRERDGAKTLIYKVCAVCRCQKRDAEKLFKVLHQLGVGQHIAGRRGEKSRLVWNYSLKSIGRVALGRDSYLEKGRIKGRVSNSDDVDAPRSATERATGSRPNGELALSLGEAKEGIARKFDIPVSAIEITIKI